MSLELLEQTYKNFVDECLGVISALKKELVKVRTGRASSSIVENIQVDYYGSKTALVHMGQISTPEPRLISIQVYDVSAAPMVEKAIQIAGLGLNPSREGNAIRVLIPALTEETRKDIVKQISKVGEDYKVSVRNHRRDTNEILKKLDGNGVSKDDVKKVSDKVQKKTDETIVEIDHSIQQKVKEVMEI